MESGGVVNAKVPAGSKMSKVQSKHGGANVGLPPPLAFLIGIAIGALLDHFVWPLPVPLGKGLRFGCGLALIAVAVALTGSALSLFQQSGQRPEPWTPSPSLIGRGPYRFSRNPIYLGMVLFQTAAGLIFDNLWIVALAAPALLMVHFTAVLPEERYLTERFGEAYRVYVAAVPRYWGRRGVGR